MHDINLCKIVLGLWMVAIINREFQASERRSVGFDVAAAIIERSGCYHNGSMFGDGSFVPTLEPCLSCKCNAKTLVCSLKICPEMPVPPPRGCVLVQKKNTCCPYLSCLRLHDYFNNAISRRIASYLDHYERESIDRVVSDNFLQKRSDDDEFDGVGDICVKNGTVYKSGSAMSSSSLCSYCYCIGGQQRCVKPKCMLPLDGCKPIFVDSTCCPVRYDCSSKAAGGKSWQQEENLKKTSNKHYQRMSQRLQRNRGCHHENNFYMEGQKMSADSDKPCDICFCIRGKRKCAPKKCAPALRSCIPVIPKGQCCPSSYDCGPPLREWDRAYQSRQIGLFSWILGDDDANNSTDDGEIDSHVAAEPISSIKPTSEKSIFDVIREGLQDIDTNESKDVIKDNEEKNSASSPASNYESTTSGQVSNESPDESDADSAVESSSVEPEEDEEDEDDINLFDLFLQTVTNVTRAPVNTTTTSTTTTTTTSNPPTAVKDEDAEDYKDYEGVSFFDIFLGKTKEEKNVTTEKKENQTATESNDFDYFNLFNDNENETYDYLSVSDPSVEHESTSTDVDAGTTDSIEARSEILEDTNEVEQNSEESFESTTMRPEYEQSSEDMAAGSGEDYTDSEERNLSTQSGENYSTEDVQVGSLSTEEDSMEELSTIETGLLENDEAAVETTTVRQQTSTKTVESTTKPMVKNLPTKRNIPLTTKPLVARESTTLRIASNSTIMSSALKQANKTEEKPSKPEIKNKMSFLSSVLGELQSLMRKTSNLTATKTTNSSRDPEATQNKVVKQNAAIVSSTTIPPFKKIHNKNINNILIETTIRPVLERTTLNAETINPKPSNNTTHLIKSKENSLGASHRTTSTSFQRPKPTTTLPPIPQKSNKGSNANILADGEDYDHNTLPPSLPNLEIIPFLPIDALPIKEKMAAHPTYPAITERHGSAENIWSDMMEDVRPFEDSDGLASLSYMSSKMDSFNEPNHNGFSPPKETEGGFVPKQPIVDGNLYYGTKLITELTTVTPSLNMNKMHKKLTSTETPIAITSTDPFKDVLKTEAPPALVLLIEDKEKHLATKESSSYEDKDIIHITTDTNYNFDAQDFKPNDVIEFNNIHFNGVNVTDSSGSSLAENFPLDRHENVTFTEKNEAMSDMSNMFDMNPSALANEANLNDKNIENDVLAENFPLDRHDDYKSSNNFKSNNNLTKEIDEMIAESDYVDGDGAGFESFLDYFLGGNGQASKNSSSFTSSTTTQHSTTSATTIPPFKVIPSNLSPIPALNSGQINDQLQSDVKSNDDKKKHHKHDTPDLSILSTLLSNNNNRFAESELYKPKPQRPFSLPNKTEINKDGQKKPGKPTPSEVHHMYSDPFKGLPGLIPSYPIKRPSEIKQAEQSDLSAILTEIQKEPFTVGAYKVIQNQTELTSTGPYVVNPIDLGELKKQQQQQNNYQQHHHHHQQHHNFESEEQQNDIHAEIFSKPDHSNSINDPAGILKLAGCNIYGRMYRVGRIISELSNACLECKCTEIGVSCISLECSRAAN